MPVFSEQRIKPQHLTQVQFSCLSNINKKSNEQQSFVSKKPSLDASFCLFFALLLQNSSKVTSIWFSRFSGINKQQNKAPCLNPTSQHTFYTSIQLNLSQRTFFALLWKFVLTSYISITSVTVQICKKSLKIYIFFFLKMLLERNFFFVDFLL